MDERPLSSLTFVPESRQRSAAPLCLAEQPLSAPSALENPNAKVRPEV
jgi:hypothetical protein